MQSPRLIGRIGLLLVVLSFASGCGRLLEHEAEGRQPREHDDRLSLAGSDSVETMVKLLAATTLTCTSVDSLKTCDAEFIDMLETAPPEVRKELLSRMVTFRLLKPGAAELRLFRLIMSALLLLCVVPPLLRVVGWTWRHGAQPRPRLRELRVVQLFLQDIGPRSFDVRPFENDAEIAEYRGVVHYVRDVAEKLLSIALVAVFVGFVVRGVYLVESIRAGHTWVLCLVALHLDLAVTLAAYALIIDGLVAVSAMTDAPGIHRTLDSVIVVLAGFVVMLLEVEPGDRTLVRLGLGHLQHLVPLCSMLALAFLVRWVVRARDLETILGPRRIRQR